MSKKQKQEFIIPKNIKGRAIALDFETTGLNAGVDKAVSVALVELKDGKPTGKKLYLEFNPKRHIPSYAVKVHGLTRKYLKDKPVFKEEAQKIIDFIGKDKPLLIAHNANFDMSFLNAEMKQAGKKLPEFNVCDTLVLAQDLYGTEKGNATLDNVLDKLGVDRTERDENGHGALIDTQLLAEAYKPLLKAYLKKNKDNQKPSVSKIAIMQRNLLQKSR